MRSTEALQGSCLLSHRNLRSIKWVSNSPGLRSLCADVEKAGLKVFKTGGVFYKSLSTPQMDWFLKNGLWAEGGFGWGRVGGEQKDWKAQFCRTSYELGKQQPEDCNIIYACVTK